MRVSVYTTPLSKEECDIRSVFFSREDNFEIEWTDLSGRINI